MKGESGPLAPTFQTIVTTNILSTRHSVRNPDIIFESPQIVVAVDSRTYAIDRAIEPLRWIFRWGSLVMWQW
jgi:hypothetical protein